MSLRGGQAGAGGQGGYGRGPPLAPGSQESLTPRPPQNAWGSLGSSLPNSSSPAPSEDSYIPPTPPLESHMPSYTERGGFTPRPPQEGSRRSSAPSSGLDYDDTASMGRGFGGDSTWEPKNDAMLEERRKKAIREREREAMARQKHRELLERKRQEQLKAKAETEKEMKRREEEMKSQEEHRKREVENARLEKLRQKEQEEAEREAEKRRQAELTMKREKALQHLESQRLRAAEEQRRRREIILEKRQQAERLREETQRLYEERLKEENQRKTDIVAAIARHRESKLAEMEARKNNPLLNQQDEELSELVQVSATVTRIASKIHEIQIKREETRHKLLEARHLVELLIMDEHDQTLSLEEAEGDFSKLKAHQEALTRLVSSRYDSQIYNKAVVDIQRIFRGARDRLLVKSHKARSYERMLQEAAVTIQSRFRGMMSRTERKRRWQDINNSREHAAVKIQALVRGVRERRRTGELLAERRKREFFMRSISKIQSWWRALKAKHMMRLLKEMEELQLIDFKKAQVPQESRKTKTKTSKAKPKPALNDHSTSGFLSSASMVDMDWVTREQHRAHQRKAKLEFEMNRKRGGELTKIYLDPIGPRGRGGPRLKRMFIPLPATEKAVSVYRIPYSFSGDGSVADVIRADPHDSPSLKLKHEVDLKIPRPMGEAPAYARNFPDLNRDQQSNFTPRISPDNPAVRYY
mmetsp:Transcript_18316/g.41694  ORF Transcript_18316/g.41694 Transcript_18316/m.41694 type:complete len:699 (-) Transcript_18316:138-2234(-)